MKTCNKDIEILIEFLKKPQNRSRFKAFFELCYQYAYGYLNYLRAKIFQLPLDNQPTHDSLSDITIDILGSFLQSSASQPYQIIFNHLNKMGISNYDEYDSQPVYDQFRSLLFSFIRQELSRIKKETDPQIDNLKRRIKDILKESEYRVFRVENSHFEFVANAEIKYEHDEYPLITYDKLLELVEDLYNLSKNRRKWCRNIFKALEYTAGVRHYLKKHELICAMINVNAKYLEINGLQPTRLTGAKYQLLEKAITDSKDQSLIWLNDNVLLRFIEDDRITSEFSKKFLVAADYYLSDMVFSSGVDLLPAYFREVMPECEHARYLQDYKYVFETSIKKVEDNFRERTKNIYKFEF